jgi:hypothetical protein
MQMYAWLAMDNDMEWELTVAAWWENMFWLALLGPFFIWQSHVSIIDVLIFPVNKPDVDMDWENMDEFSQWYLEWVSWTAWIGQPNLFFWTQLFTFGESNY